jgi:archaemetzincin
MRDAADLAADLARGTRWRRRLVPWAVAGLATAVCGFAALGLVAGRGAPPARGATPAERARARGLGDDVEAAGAGRPTPATSPDRRGATSGSRSRPGARAPVQPASRSAARVARTRFGAAAALKRAARFAAAPDDCGFRRLGEPRPGEWLWEFPESGQTLAEYLRAGVNRKNAVRRVFHLQPFGDLRPDQRATLAAVRRVAAAFFDTEVVPLPERRPSPVWYHDGRRQWDGDLAVRSLAQQVPADSLGLLGVMGSDLYGLGLNFIFGVGLMRARAALLSLHRYDTRDEQLLLRRALKVTLHELGHVLTLKHCVFYRCLMNGSNSLAELDGQPLWACPVCRAKLRANLRFDPAARDARLAAVYRRLGLAAEAAFYRRRPLTASSPGCR